MKNPRYCINQQIKKIICKNYYSTGQGDKKVKSTEKSIKVPFTH